MLFGGSVSHAQIACEALLHHSGVILTNKEFSSVAQNDSKLIPEMTLKLLLMSARTKDESFNEKVTLEKGEIF